MLVGANHDWFNTEWTPGLADGPAEDDWWGGTGPCATGAPERLDAAAQRRVTRTYVAGAVRLLASRGTAFLPMYDGSRVSVPSAGEAVVLSHAVGAGRALRRPGADAVATPATGGARTQLCRGVAPAAWSARACGRLADDRWTQLPHWPAAPALAPTRPAFEMGWTATGATGGLRLREPWDVSTATALDLRTIVDPARGTVQVEVRLTDAAGRTATVSPPRSSPLPSGGESPGRPWAQTLRVPLPAAGLDLRTLQRVDLVARSEQGRVWVLDLSAVGDDLPPVPARRAPLLDLGSVTLREDDRGTVARIPYRVRGTPDRGATVRLGGCGTSTAARSGGPCSACPPDPPPAPSPGPSAGGRSDSLARTVTRVTAYGLSGVVAGDAAGQVTVLDDDPPPRVRVRAVRDRVSEGRALVWVVSWRPPSDYAPFVRRRLVPAHHGRSVSDDDLRLGYPASTEHALSDPRTRRWVVRVPVRRDGEAEPREVVRVRLAIPQYGWRTAVRGVVRRSR